MTSLLDRPAAGGNGQSQPPATRAYAAWHAAKLWQTAKHAIKYEIIEIKFDLYHKLVA